MSVASARVIAPASPTSTLQEVKDLLGHSTLAMVMRYAHLSPEHLRSALLRHLLRLAHDEWEVLDAVPRSPASILLFPPSVQRKSQAQEVVSEGVLLRK
jgi:hypothetical protein